jgi:hypothetical protein
MNLQGPFKVAKVEGSVYTLLDTVKGKTLEKCDIHLLRPYQHHARYTDPTAMRMKDSKDMYEVEAITQHSGTFSTAPKSKLRFKVKWFGWPDSTWEPYSGVRDCEVLHDYLRQHKQSRLIPEKFSEK